MSDTENEPEVEFTELLVIIGQEDESSNFEPSKDKEKPFIEVEKGLVGDVCLRHCIVADAFKNFARKKKEKKEELKPSYFVDILMIENKQEVAIVFKTPIEDKKEEFTDDLPIIRYDRVDTSSIFDCFIKKLQEELEVDEIEVMKHNVSREILIFLFPNRFKKYIQKMQMKIRMKG